MKQTYWAAFEMPAGILHYEVIEFYSEVEQTVYISAH